MNYKALLLGTLIAVIPTGQLYAAAGSPVIDGFVEPAGYVQSTSFAAATALTVPAGARLVLIQAEGDSLRWRDDGSDPTAAVGMLLEAGQTLVYNGTMSKFKFIEVSTNSIVNISYYR